MSNQKNKHPGYGGKSTGHGMKIEAAQSAVEKVPQSQPVIEDVAKIRPKSIVKAESIMVEVQKMQKDLDENFVNFLKGLPTMIMQNGLGQTVAFLQTKDTKEQTVAKLLDKLLVLPSDDRTKPLMKRILNDNIENYNFRQREAIECAGWIKKFAVAFRKTTGAAKDDKEKEKDA